MIDLARLDARAGESEAGRRDLFLFGVAADRGAGRLRRRRAADERAPPRRQPPAPHAAPRPHAHAPAHSGASIHRLGGERPGVKVAVLVTDRREVLTGRGRDVVANRYRIARIGLESVDLEDVGSGQSRRIPLKGN